jgi:hypothetical protein
VVLSLSAGFKEAIARSGSQLLFLVEIDLAGGTFKALSGKSDVISTNVAAHSAVLSVSPLAYEIDPVTRRMQTGGVTVELDDGFVRPLLPSNRFKGRQVTIKIGARELPEVDYADYFVGPIDTIIPVDGQKVELEVLNSLVLLEDAKVTGQFIFTHTSPSSRVGNAFRYMEEILEKADVPAALIDSPSFDRANAAYDEVGHFGLARGKGETFYADLSLRIPADAFTQVEQISQLLNGGIIINEDGKLSFKQFDGSAAAVANWGKDDIDEFEQVELGANLINRVEVFWLRHQSAWNASHIAEDVTSQNNHALPGQTNRIISHQITGPGHWLNSGANLPFAIDATQTAWTFFRPGVGFSGTEGMCPGPQPTNADVSMLRPVYVKIDNEIIRITSMQLRRTSDCAAFSLDDPDNPTAGLENFGDFPMAIDVLTSVRGVLGTTNAAHQGSALQDYTVPVWIADRILERFSDGVDIVECTTSFSEYDKQVADLVTLTWPEYLSFGRDGITPSTKWEIISKEADLDSTPPRIKWRLAVADVPAPTIAAVLTSPASPFAIANAFQTAVAQQDTVVSAIVEGLEITNPSGFNVDVSAGAATSGAQRVEFTAVTSFLFEATTDNYIFVDTVTSSMGSISQPNGFGSQPAPDLAAGQVLIGVVITDATVVVNIDETNRQETTSTGYTKAISAETVFNGNIATNTDFGLFSKG